MGTLSKVMGLLLAAFAAFAADLPSIEFFEQRVRPVLAANCWKCHTAARMGGLELDSREHVLKGGNSGPAAVAGHADESLLIQAVSHTHARLKMPPGGKLPDEAIAALRTWIDAGAVWPETTRVVAPRPAFWSLQPAARPPVPQVKDAAWARSDIDRFILAKLEPRGLKPAKPADRRTLLRRAYFDLTGLPPSPEEVDAFLADRSPDAFANVVDRLLASPRYGERWGRHWLDVARYSDDKLNSTMDEPYGNAFRYRDWVIRAFNDDMPYDQFVKAQIAGDLMGPEFQAGLGFYALSPEFQDDRVDATTRGFLGLTVACAQCHDHKFDPIPTQDYYSLQGIFSNTELDEIPLAPEAEVKAYKDQKAGIEKKEAELKSFLERQGAELAEILAAQTARFLLASRQLVPAAGLDAETLRRWTKHLARKDREHPFLKAWDELAARGAGAEEFRKAAADFEKLVLSVNEEKKLIDDKNHLTLGLNPSRRDLSGTSLLSLERDKYVLWRDLFDTRGVLRYGEKDIEPYLAGQWKDHLARLRAEVAELKKALPPQYPFLHAIRDAKQLKKQRVFLRGNRETPGEDAPPRFLAVLSAPDRKPFTQGSGRLELAEAIADPKNPLTARVMVNRIWMHHFGQGIVRTPSNFGQLGDRPSHPELLDYLATRLIENRWSIKALHREIMLSSVYALSAEGSAGNEAVDPENRLLWRANRRRLDVESMRDALLYVAGNLDLESGGPPRRFTDDNRRRTVYGFVSRRKLDGLQALFDFPNPMSTSDQRLVTNVPLQRLFFMNSSFVAQESKALARRLHAGGERERIREIYRTALDRAPTEAEVKLGFEFLKDGTWPEYAQVVLSSNEFGFVN